MSSVSSRLGWGRGVLWQGSVWHDLPQTGGVNPGGGCREIPVSMTPTYGHPNYHPYYLLESGYSI
jgi:hypothetical protein